MDMSVELAQIMSRKATAKEMTAEFAELGAPSPDCVCIKTLRCYTHIHTHICIHTDIIYKHRYQDRLDAIHTYTHIYVYT